MILEQREYKLFLETHLRLLHFVSIEYDIFGEKLSYKEFKNLDIPEKFECREQLLKNLEIIEKYLNINFEKLKQQEINILKGLKKSIIGNFIIFRQLKKYAIMIDTESNSVYGVLALNDKFEMFFDFLPTLAKLTILPFFNKIIYDGFIESHNVRLGPGIKNNLNELYQEAKINRDIITSF